jgi:hypothetical protein
MGRSDGAPGRAYQAHGRLALHLPLGCVDVEAARLFLECGSNSADLFEY